MVLGWPLGSGFLCVSVEMQTPGLIFRLGVCFVSSFILFRAYECFACMYVCAPHVCPVPTEVRRGHWMLWSLESWATTWILRVKSWSSAKSHACPWADLSRPHSLVFIRNWVLNPTRKIKRHKWFKISYLRWVGFVLKIKLGTLNLETMFFCVSFQN